MRIAATSASIALSWPNTTFFRSRSSVFSALRSSEVTFFAGMRAILATISSISVLLITFFCFDFGRIFCAAPASSITSIALSGRWRSLMKRAESSAARRERRRRVLDAVVLLEARLQALQDLDGLGDRRLGHVDLLEAPRQRVVLLEDLPVLVVGRRADALQRAGRQRRLQQVRRVERAARRRAGADDRVDLVDEQDRLRIVGELLQHRLQALLEIAAVLGAGEQRAHVERVHLVFAQELGHVALVDAARESLGDRGLAHAGLADQQRIVLAPAAQHLDHALELVRAADQRIDLALLRQRVEVERVARARPAPRCRPRRRPSPRPSPASAAGSW